MDAWDKENYELVIELCLSDWENPRDLAYAIFMRARALGMLNRIDEGKQLLESHMHMKEMAEYGPAWAALARFYKDLTVDHDGDGSYGETIRFFANSEGGVRSLLWLFRTLAERPGSAINVTDAGVQSFTHDITSLVCQSIVGKAPAGTQFVPQRSGDSGSWTWRGYQDQWRVCEEMMNAILEFAAPCHQYLTELDSGDVLVEVSYRE